MKLSDLQEWVLDVIASTRIDTDVFVGRFVADGTNSDKYLISIQKSGGTTRPPFLRYDNYTLVILSPVYEFGNDDDTDGKVSLNGDTDKPIPTTQTDEDPIWQNLEILSEAISVATDGLKLPCGASGMSLLSNYQGINYTEDGRMYTTMAIQLII